MTNLSIADDNVSYNKFLFGFSTADDDDQQMDHLFPSRFDNLTVPLRFLSSSASQFPKAFELPFEDPRLEPRPIEEMISKSMDNQSPSLANSSVSGDDDDSGDAPSSERASSPEPHNGQLSKRFKPFQEDSWTANYLKLIQFRDKHGHCCVPYSHKDRALVRWTKRQRIQYKKLKDGDPRSSMTLQRLEKLEDAGFVWRAHGAAWLDKLNELEDFKNAKGHCNVPSLYRENQALSTWVKSQRRQYKLYKSGQKSGLTEYRIHALASLGFVFEPRQK